MRTTGGPAGAAALVLLAALASSAPSVRGAPMTDAQALRHERAAPSAPAPETPTVDESVRAIVERVDRARARAAAPGLSDEERDALTELAWGWADEALDDPALRERAQRDPDFLQVQALLLMDDGEDEDALGVLQRLAVIAPRDPETHVLLAQVFLGLGRTAGAVEEYRRALALDEDATDIRAHLGYALALAGRPDEGLAECDRAIVGDPSAYLGHFVRGWILGEAGRRDEERREYLEAVRHERDDADLWEQLARSWERAGDGARAQEAWREVARIDPSDKVAAEKVGGKR